MKKSLISVALTGVNLAALLLGSACGMSKPSPSTTPPLEPTSTPLPRSTVPGDQLTGSGEVGRTMLAYNDLFSGSSTSPLDDGAFALPTNAATPEHAFEGRLELAGEAANGGFSEIKDTYGYSGQGDNPRKHLPKFSFEFVQNGSHLIPVTQGLVYTGHPYWNYIIGPGRVWKEIPDKEYSRAAFPFALVERNANCTHNGVMIFLFNNTNVSAVRYQITQETCVYFKFNMWGQLAAKYTPYPVPNAATIKARHATEVSDRLPTRPISALSTDFPDSHVNVSVFGSGITAEDMTFYGLVFNGVNYISACHTRYGTYAFCENLRAPSYSTAKSAFAATALMRLGQKYGTGVYNLLIKDYLPETSASIGKWGDVTFKNTLDMATGNYRQSEDGADEAGLYMDAFFQAETYADKMNAALNFPNQAAPGKFWIYHSSDTFILVSAMNNYLKSQEGSGADIFNMLRSEVYDPIKLSAGVSTLRTGNNSSGVAFGGYGLFWTQDDIAKLAKLFNNDSGMAGGVQLLEPTLLADSMQKNNNVPGLDTTGAISFKYNNSFWAKHMTPTEFPQYKCAFWVPFMSGYGGITVAMLPNSATYYYFSDNEEYSWYNAIKEANKLLRFCP